MEEELGQRQGSLTIPIHDTNTPTSSATLGSPEQEISPQKEGHQPPVSSIGENTATSEVIQSWGEFSSKQMKLGCTIWKVGRKHGVSSYTWEALSEGLYSFPPLPQVFLSQENEGSLPNWKGLGHSQREGGSLSHSGLPTSLYSQTMLAAVIPKTSFWEDQS